MSVIFNTKYTTDVGRRCFFYMLYVCYKNTYKRVSMFCCLYIGIYILCEHIFTIKLNSCGCHKTIEEGISNGWMSYKNKALWSYQTDSSSCLIKLQMWKENGLKRARDEIYYIYLVGIYSYTCI